MSTSDAIIDLDNEKHCGSVFVNFGKGLDTVRHTILFDKLDCHGLGGLL